MRYYLEGSNVKRINQGIFPNVIAGATAAIIYFVITLATGGSAARAVLGGLLIGVVTFGVAFLISQAIARAKRQSQ
jgi:hypothetical protein